MEVSPGGPEPYEERLGRELFAEAAYAVGVWVDWSVPLDGNPSVREATHRIGYQFALVQAEATRIVRDAVAAGSAPPPPADERAFVDWRDHVLPVFFERGEGLLRFAVRDALRDDFRALVIAGSWYKSLPRGLDYRSPLTWTNPALRTKIEAVVRECSFVASQAERGSLALQDASDQTNAPPWGTVPESARTVELALYRLGLAVSRFTFALHIALREASGVGPLPKPAPPPAVNAQGDPVDAEGNVLPVPPMPEAPEPLVVSAPWSDVLPALASGGSEVEASLLAVLGGPAPDSTPARRLGRQWSVYHETVARLPLDTLTDDGRAEVERLAAEVAAHARAVSEAAS